MVNLSLDCFAVPRHLAVRDRSVIFFLNIPKKIKIIKKCIGNSDGGSLPMEMLLNRPETKRHSDFSTEA